MLDSSDILIVQTITDLGSISKAAEQLHMSQPTLSKRISRLEDVLNITLFHRHNVGMKPTEAARYLMEHGSSIQNKLNAMERHISMLANLEEGDLRLGIGPIIEQLFFPKVLLDFTAENPGIDITLSTETTDRMLELLLNGGIDVAIGPFLHDELPDDLIIRRVQSAKILFVARPNHPIFRNIGQTVERHVLEKHRVVGPVIPDSMLDQVEEEYRGRPQITCVNYNICKSMVLNSDHITAGPEQLFHAELAEGILKEIPTGLEMEWTSYCLIKPESLHAPPVKRFLELFNRYLDQT